LRSVTVLRDLRQNLGEKKTDCVSLAGPENEKSRVHNDSAFMIPVEFGPFENGERRGLSQPSALVTVLFRSATGYLRPRITVEMLGNLAIPWLE
jgi:hypothetical protein